MTMNVNIKVKGSSIIYFRDGMWNVIFITDGCHDAQFNNPDNALGYKPLTLPSISRPIEFRAAGTAAATGWDAGQAGNFFNLSDPRLHGTSGTASNLKVVPDLKFGRQYIHIKIPYGQLRMTGSLSADYLYKRYGALSWRFWGKGVAEQFAISFDVNDSNGLYMHFFDPVTPVPLNFPLRNGPLELSFRNDCGVWKPYNDFIHVYDWVHDVTSTDPENPKRFLAKEETDDLRIPAEVPDEEADNFEKRLWMSGTQGDCDPSIIEPPPLLGP